MCLSFPEAVLRKRFLIAFFVFIFGMALHPAKNYPPKADWLIAADFLSGSATKVQLFFYFFKKSLH